MCTPLQHDCYLAQAGKHDCLEACFGLYADVSFENATYTKSVDYLDHANFQKLQAEYKIWKNAYVDNLEFDPDNENYSEYYYAK